MENRAYTTGKLREMGFTVLDSKANFIFAGHPGISGENLYQKLKEKGILVRYFSAPRLSHAVRITIGTQAQMDGLLTAVAQILEDVL